jgi:hypothetical protein
MRQYLEGSPDPTLVSDSRVPKEVVVEGKPEKKKRAPRNSQTRDVGPRDFRAGDFIGNQIIPITSPRNTHSRNKKKAPLLVPELNKKQCNNFNYFYLLLYIERKR